MARVTNVCNTCTYYENAVMVTEDHLMCAGDRCVWCAALAGECDKHTLSEVQYELAQL